MMSKIQSSTTRFASKQRSFAFTLIEVLVVLLILLLLAAIALPNVKDLIANQLVARTARGISSYIDVARNRAISEGRQVGVLIERFGTDPRGKAHSIRLRQLTSVPPYTGDASNATAVLQPGGTTAHFDPSSNQLLTLSASMVADPGVVGDVDDPQAPIRNGDYIELPGGRIVPFIMTFRDLGALPTVPVVITFDLTELQNGIELFPSSGKTISVARNVKYKIHRRPVVSTMAPYSFPRGIAIDLNYSGYGVSGNEFAPVTVTPMAEFNLAIVFGPDGKIVSVTNPLTGVSVSPVGQMFLCLGDNDGISPGDLFSQQSSAIASLLNLKSVWLVLNPSTGRVVVSPMAPVSAIPAATITDTSNGALAPAIAQARLFANLSDTVNQE